MDRRIQMQDKNIPPDSQLYIYVWCSVFSVSIAKLFELDSYTEYVADLNPDG